MKKKRTKINAASVRKNAAYTIPEASTLLSVHKNTIREWVKDGLPCIRDQRPHLILGHELKQFLRVRAAQRKHKCRPDELYCCRCKSPRRTLGNMADVQMRNAKTFMLSGICVECESRTHKMQSVRDAKKITKLFDIPTLQQERLLACHQALVNCDIKKEEL